MIVLFFLGEPGSKTAAPFNISETGNHSMEDIDANTNTPPTSMADPTIPLSMISVKYYELVSLRMVRCCKKIVVMKKE